MKEVSVIGLGFVGLPLALVISEKGGKVHGIDINKQKIDELNEGVCFLEEEKLISLWEKERSNMHFSSVPEVSDVYIIAVPTPLKRESNDCDYSYVFSAVKNIIPLLKSGDSVILVSTCPVGTLQKITKEIQEKLNLFNGTDYNISYCPERLFPGNTYEEIKENWHLIGGSTNKCTETIKEFYRNYITEKVIGTSAEVAEFVKLSENTFRDVNIALANEISELAAQKNVDISEIIKLSNLHPRVNIHQPDIGVGGHCLPIDPWFLYPSESIFGKSIITAARQINNHKPILIAQKIYSKVLDLLDKSKSEQSDSQKSSFSHVLILGYTYKPNIKDIRESPALEVFNYLSEKDLKVKKYDPLIEELSIEQIKELNRNSLLTILLIKHDAFGEILPELNYLNWSNL